MPESSPSMKAPAHDLTSGRLKTLPSRLFRADNSCSHPSIDPDQTATDMPHSLPPTAENQALNRFATVVLIRLFISHPYRTGSERVRRRQELHTERKDDGRLRSARLA